MKLLTLKIIIPLTIILFAIVTKWWYVLVVDGPDEILTGFPLPFVCSGWHTSMSLQIFVTEFIIDLLTYFVFSFVIIFFIDRFLTKIKTYKIITIGLYTLTGLIIIAASLIASNPDNRFKLKRNFDMEVMATGHRFFWQKVKPPDFYKYYPERKEE